MLLEETMTETMHGNDTGMNQRSMRPSPRNEDGISVASNWMPDAVLDITSTLLIKCSVGGARLELPNHLDFAIHHHYARDFTTNSAYSRDKTASNQNTIDVSTIRTLLGITVICNLR